MKIPALTLAAVLFTVGAVSVQASAIARTASRGFPAGISNLPAPALILSLPAGTETLSGNLRAGTSHFAQFDTDRSQPVSLSMVFMLIALFTLGVRLMILRQAHSLAEHERHSHHGRAQMFQALHEEQSSRR
jgi:hypothetical protein